MAAPGKREERGRDIPVFNQSDIGFDLSRLNFQLWKRSGWVVAGEQPTSHIGSSSSMCIDLVSTLGRYDIISTHTWYLPFLAGTYLPRLYQTFKPPHPPPQKEKKAVVALALEIILPTFYALRTCPILPRSHSDCCPTLSRFYSWARMLGWYQNETGHPPVLITHCSPRPRASRSGSGVRNLISTTADQNVILLTRRVGGKT